MKISLENVISFFIPFCQIVYYYSAALSTGHCLCGTKKGNGVPCQAEDDRNQINPNNLVRTEIVLRDEWTLVPLISIDKAFVMFDQTNNENAWACIAEPKRCYRRPKPISFHDLGIILPKKGTTFNEIHNFIIPLCLPAEDTSIPELDSNGKDAIITFVGWGEQYNEEPTAESQNWQEDLRDPKWTSCTTNHFGLEWDITVKDTTKLKRCKIEFLRDEVVKKGWKGCKKCPPSGCLAKDLPVGYEFDRCDDYWVQVLKVVKNQVDPKKVSEFDNVKKIKIKNSCDDYETECLRLDLFQDRGWCEIDDGTLDDWGICDYSCDQVEVRLYFHFYEFYPY